LHTPHAHTQSFAAAGVSKAHAMFTRELARSLGRRQLSANIVALVIFIVNQSLPPKNNTLWAYFYFGQLQWKYSGAGALKFYNLQLAFVLFS